jgi:hypothetical protein
LTERTALSFVKHLKDYFDTNVEYEHLLLIEGFIDKKSDLETPKKAVA